MNNTIDQDLIDDAVAAGFVTEDGRLTHFHWYVDEQLAKFAQLQRERQAQSISSQSVYESTLLSSIKDIMQKYKYQCRDMADEIVKAAWQARAQLSNPQPTSQDVVDAARYHCLCSMATNDYERSVGYQFVGKLNDFVDDIKPCVDEALAERKEDK